MKSVTCRFRKTVVVQVHGAFLSCAGPLLCHPILRLRASRGGAILAESAPQAFTAHPSWDVPLVAELPVSFEGGVSLEVVDAVTDEFLGTVAPLPLPLAAALKTAPHRMMLAARCEGGRPLDADAALLRKHKEDDFGHVDVSCEVRRHAPGGARLAVAATDKAPLAAPVGCSLRVQWLATQGSGANHAVTATFGGDAADLSESAYRVEYAAPLHVAIARPADGNVRLGMWADNEGVRSEVGEVRFTVPVGVFDTEHVSCWPVEPLGGGSHGVAVVTFTVTRQPLAGFPAASPAAGGAVNDPKFNATTPPPAMDWGRGPPETAPGPFHPIAWESLAHFGRATARRGCRSVALDAKPQPEHLRHLYDVIKRDAELNAAMLPLVTAFYNLPQAGAGAPLACDLRALLVAMAFASAALDVREAAAFAFEAVRLASNGAALSLGDVAVYIAEHCLLPKTLDLPAADILRRVQDAVASQGAAFGEPTTAGKFDALFGTHWGFWHTHGVLLDGAGAAPAVGAAMPDGSTGEGELWRHFVIRVAKTNKAFAVTAHHGDTFARVSKQIEAAVGIEKSRQRMLVEGVAVDHNATVGSVITPSATAAQEVSVLEQDDSVALLLVHREKGHKWEHRLPLKDRVLKLRAHVQHKTMIPLSRVKLSFAGKTLWDRHALDHYELHDGAIVEVS
jgi:hypothetical protein